MVSPMIRSTEFVEKPVEEVFDYAAHFERHPEWQDDLKAAAFDGPAAVGATGTETRQMGPRANTYEWRITAFEPPRLLGFETLTGPMRPAGTMSFTADGEGTRVDFEMALNPQGVMKLLHPFIERQVQKASDRHLEKFRAILERT
jgi:uncharacterized membrane protein